MERERENEIERKREEKMKAQMKKCNAERLMIRRTISSDATIAATAAVEMKLKKVALFRFKRFNLNICSIL